MTPTFLRSFVLGCLLISSSLFAAAQRFRAIVPYVNEGGKLIVSLKVNANKDASCLTRVRLAA